jgi:hypothetical protein
MAGAVYETSMWSGDGGDGSIGFTSGESERTVDGRKCAGGQTGRLAGGERSGVVSVCESRRSGDVVASDERCRAGDSAYAGFGFESRSERTETDRMDADNDSFLCRGYAYDGSSSTLSFDASERGLVGSVEGASRILASCAFALSCGIEVCPCLGLYPGSGSACRSLFVSYKNERKESEV